MRSAAVVLLALAVVACGDDDASSTTTAVDVSTSALPSTTPTTPARATIAPTVPPPSSLPVLTTTVATTVPVGAVVPRDAVVPEGFEQAAATVTAADGTECELCLWLAETGSQRALGLMYVTDLGGPDGMIFRYDSPNTSAFWMKNTVMPLSIAFYDQGGAYLDAFDMAPCTADPCPTYPTPANFTDAIEVPQGMLAELGIKTGSVLVVSDLPCDG
jgi:uncharacterized membrane protein (UPF0127 family)